ncbi:YidC/Oxa1 family insertase periplasmic-domain containing protein, partial [bacterium]|nr:YidC/Oxa1 family insertase periplasmic-domain containing protein [bacterium]
MDRKAWIVVIICSILLALNIHMQSKNSALAAQKAMEKQEAEALANPPLAESPAADLPGLVVEKPVLAPSEKPVEHKIETETNVFTLSSLEGGIKHALFKDELAVNDLEQNVLMNDLGPNFIGALVDSTGKTLDVPSYKIKEQTADSVTYIGRLTNGLGVKKTWSKATEGDGADYRLSLNLELVNLGDTSVSLGNLFLSTGSAAPLIDTEQTRYRSFFWQAEGDFESEMQTYFEGGMMSKEKLEFVEEIESGVEFSGVENQFFATIVDPIDLYRATVRARPKTIELPDSRGGLTAKIIFSSLSLPDETLDANGTKTLKFDIYVGPKNNSLIRSLDGEKGGVMNYGFFSPIS